MNKQGMKMDKIMIVSVHLSIYMHTHTHTHIDTHLKVGKIASAAFTRLSTTFTSGR